jgi:cleavage and polyadenylation specificity factor subunit 1
MSFAAYKMMQWPTGVDNCASGYLTHSRSDFTPRIPSLQPDDDDLDSDWVSQPPDLAPLPNLVITAANILEVYIIRLQLDPPKSSSDSRVLDGIAGASLELVCHYRFRFALTLLQFCKS